MVEKITQLRNGVSSHCRLRILRGLARFETVFTQWYLFVEFVEHFYVDIIFPFVGLNLFNSELAKAAVVKSSVADPEQDPQEL
jgi:hypothetical protein